MKKTITLSLLVCLATFQFAQTFSFQLFFEDAVGNRDTLTFGYDATAGSGIDPAFGEVNIISQAWDSVFEVRITDEWRNRNGNAPGGGTYHTKTQILGDSCGRDDWVTSEMISAVDIKARHWPVTARWDSALFKTACRGGSVFTSVNPGGWWDTGSPSDLDRTHLELTDSVTFTANGERTSGADFYGYINGQQDSLSVFWLAIGSYRQINLPFSIDDPAPGLGLSVYPNPVKDVLHIDLLEAHAPAQTVQLFDLQGRLVHQQSSTRSFDVSTAKAGMYLLKVTLQNGMVGTQKVFIDRR